MRGKKNKLTSQGRMKDYGEEAAKETKALSQGDNEFDGADNKFKEACAEENAFDTVRAEESATREHSWRARNMSGYATGTMNEPKEEEEEENADGKLQADGD